ncbi:MAG: hypothetical protein BroJett003_00830 [Planctomycetota bacterium]|nr:MAG: hypothetical protein BroJett003_00830 [Planctomycetota bacterium]
MSGSLHHVRSVCFFLLLVVCGLRPLIHETHDAARDVVSSGIAELSPAMPVRTWAIDLVILVAAAGAMLARVGEGGPRRTGLSLGFMLLSAAALISCAAAGQKRVAVNASIDFLCLPVLAIGLIQAGETRLHRRLMLAVIAASAAANAVECLDQRWFTLPEARGMYEEDRAAFWRDRGVPLDSATVRMFEARMRAGEPDGFFFHSNVAAGYLALTSLAAAGVVLAACRRVGVTRSSGVAGDTGRVSSAAVGCGVALVMLLVLAMTLTGSGGAAAAFAAAVAGWGGLAALWRWTRFGAWMARRKATALVVGWGCAGLAGAAVVGHGLYHKSLPGASLSFRWQYWTASASLIRDHFLTGVGAENFGRHYVQYKSIESPEEVSSPHNFLVQAASEWGVVGLLGLIALLVGGSARLAGIGSRGGNSDPTAAGKPSAGWDETEDRGEGEVEGLSGAAVPAWCAVTGLAVFAMRIPLLGSTDASFVFVQTLIPAAAWFSAFAVVMRLVGGAGGDVTDGPIFGGVCAGLAAFFIQDAINFALFVPGAATTVFALYAMVASRRRELASARDDGLRRRAGIKTEKAALVVCAALLMAVIWQGAAICRGNAALAEARGFVVSVKSAGGAAQGHVLRATAKFDEAAKADPWDPTPCIEKAEFQAGLWLGGVESWVGGGFESIRSALDEARRRDPFRVEIERKTARIELEVAMRAGVGGGEWGKGVAVQRRHLNAAAEAAGRAVNLYPADPTGWWLLGECLLHLGEAQGDPGVLGKAALAFERALKLDAARPEWEVIRRFSRDERSQLEAACERAKALGGGRGGGG